MGATGASPDEISSAEYIYLTVKAAWSIGALPTLWRFGNDPAPTL